MARVVGYFNLHQSKACATTCQGYIPTRYAKPRSNFCMLCGGGYSNSTVLMMHPIATLLYVAANLFSLNAQKNGVICVWRTHFVSAHLLLPEIWRTHFEVSIFCYQRYGGHILKCPSSVTRGRDQPYRSFCYQLILLLLHCNRILGH